MPPTTCSRSPPTADPWGTSELAQPIIDGLPDLLAEVALAAGREQARSIGDVLLRRTRLGLLAARELTAAVSLGDGERDGNSVAAVRRVGDVLARELRWSPERLERELQRFAEEAAAEGLVADLQPASPVPLAGSPPPAPMP